MGYELSKVIEGEIAVRLHDPREFQILWNDEFNYAGVYVPAEESPRGFLFAEDSDYTPMPRRSFDTEEDSPFQTDARQVLINLATAQYGEHDTHYEEGDIQGLVYAATAFQFEDERILEQEDYQRAIEGWVSELATE